LGFKLDDDGKPIDDNKASNALNLNFKEGTSVKAQEAISAVVQSQMQLWKAVNKRCDALGLDCSYHVDTCAHPSSPPVVADLKATSWPFQLKWTAPGANALGKNGRTNLRYSVMMYQPGPTDKLDDAVKDLDDKYEATITRPIDYASPSEWEKRTAGQVVEYHVIADAKCHSEKD